MKHLLFIIGDELLINENFKSYILRKYEEKFKEINEVKFYNKCDKDLPFLLEKLSEEFDFITLFTINEYYATIAKIIATLSNDTLILKDDFLVPNKAVFTKDSFLSLAKECKINLIKVSINENLPELIGDLNLNFAYFCIFGMDNLSINLLIDALKKTYDMSVKSSEIVENLSVFKCESLNANSVDGFLSALKNLFGGKLILEKNIIKFIANKLIEKNLKISFAESCTGGMCASELTAISGVSEIFEGSVVSYSNRLKHEWLGILESVLEDGGEYSEKCIYFMLKGIFKTAKCDFGVAISGVAGENDALNTKAGTIYIGAMYKDGTYIQEILHLKGDRNYMREKATNAAFCLLLKLKPEIFEM